MALYLVQHSESKSKDEDPQRPLTDEGLKNANKVASYAKEHIHIKVSAIFHSGKLRAEQTSEVFAMYLEPEKGFKEIDGLEPMANPNIWAERLAKINDNIMLVGHLPHLGKLAGILLNSDENMNPIIFRNAGIVKLSRDENNNRLIDWIIVPSII
jgi:phosphohistidine phosphatase